MTLLRRVALDLGLLPQDFHLIQRQIFNVFSRNFSLFLDIPEPRLKFCIAGHEGGFRVNAGTSCQIYGDKQHIADLVFDARPVNRIMQGFGPKLFCFLVKLGDDVVDVHPVEPDPRGAFLQLQRT